VRQVGYLPEFLRQIFEKYSCRKFQEYTFSDSQIVPRGCMDRQMDMTKLVFALSNSVNGPKNTLRGHNVGSLSTKACGIRRRQSTLRTQRLILKIMQIVTFHVKFR